MLEIIDESKGTVVEEYANWRGDEESFHLLISSHSIVIPCSPFEIAVESIGNIQNLSDMDHTQRLAFIDSQCLRSADGVFDLFIVSLHPAPY